MLRRAPAAAVKLRLTNAARKQLKRRKKLKLGVTYEFLPSAGGVGLVQARTVLLRARTKPPKVPHRK